MFKAGMIISRICRLDITLRSNDNQNPYNKIPSKVSDKITVIIFGDVDGYFKKLLDRGDANANS